MKLATVSRRAALAWGAAALVVPKMAFADSSCSPADESGDRLCTAAFKFGDADTARQLKPHWCWAACIQTIFAAHGYNVSQDKIVEKIYGTACDRTATGPQILSAIDGRWTGDNGKQFDAKGFVLWDRVDSFERPDALVQAAAELQQGNPLIVATDRHTLVLTAMIYSERAKGEIIVSSLTVRDPWPNIANRHDFPVSEIPKSGFLCGVHVDAV